MNEYKNKINKIIPLSKTNLFFKNKLILSSNTLENLKSDIKKNISMPKKDKTVFIIRVKFDPEDETAILTINCSKKKITPDLKLTNVVGSMKTIIYTQEDLKDLGFTLTHLKKIIKIVDNDLLTKNITSNINEVLSV
jgi:hypothetical protein